MKVLKSKPKPLDPKEQLKEQYKLDKDKLTLEQRITRLEEIIL